MITTDVWARGIDVQQVSLVINYDLPAYVARLILLLAGLLMSFVETVKTTSIALVALVVLAGKVLPSTYVTFAVAHVFSLWFAFSS